MKIALAFVLIIVLSFKTKAQYEDHIIISDLDDTYKITNTKFKPITVLNALCTRKTFIGMTELYKEMSKSTYRFYILSSSPEFIRKKVEKLMQKTGLQPDSIILKPSGMRGPVYKYTTIKKIFESNPDKKFILIGDDSGHDHKIYSKLDIEYPNRVTAIYIRPVKYKKRAESIRNYFSAYDIACNESLDLRFSKNKAFEISEKILASNKKKYLIPHYLKIVFSQAKTSTNEKSNEFLDRKTKVIEHLKKLKGD